MKKDDQAHEIFKKMRQVEIEPSPFMKTRVMANLGTRPAGLFSRTLVSKMAVLAVCCMALVSTIYLNQEKGSNYEGLVHQAIALKVPLNEGLDIAYAEFGLGSDLQFYSTKHDLTKLKKLKLNINRIAKNEEHFPVILKSDTVGVKQVNLTLYNENREVVKQQTIKIEFFNDIQS